MMELEEIQNMICLALDKVYQKDAYLIISMPQITMCQKEGLYLGIIYTGMK